MQRYNSSEQPGNLAEDGLMAARGATLGKSGFTIERNPNKGISQVNGYATARSMAISLRDVLLLIGSVAILIVAGLGVWLATRISRPVAKVADALSRLAEGDSSQKVEYTGTHEIGLLAQSLNQTVSEISSALQSDKADWAELTARTEIMNMTNIISHSDLKGVITECK